MAPGSGARMRHRMRRVRACGRTSPIRFRGRDPGHASKRSICDDGRRRRVDRDESPGVAVRDPDFVPVCGERKRAPPTVIGLPSIAPVFGFTRTTLPADSPTQSEPSPNNAGWIIRDAHAAPELACLRVDAIQAPEATVVVVCDPQRALRDRDLAALRHRESGIGLPTTRLSQRRPTTANSAPPCSGLVWIGFVVTHTYRPSTAAALAISARRIRATTTSRVGSIRTSRRGPVAHTDPAPAATASAFTSGSRRPTRTPPLAPATRTLVSSTAKGHAAAFLRITSNTDVLRPPGHVSPA